MDYIICTHHRCGTVLMQNTFRNFSKKTELGFFKGDYFEKPNNVSIIQNSHSKIDELPTDTNFLGLHLYRDPYEMLLSNINYHQKTESPTEACNKIMIKGVVYKDYLKSLNNLTEQALFELDNIFYRTMKNMLDWDYTNSKYLNLNLNVFRENFIEDTTLAISNHFHFTEEQSEILNASFRAANNNKAVIAKHMTKKSEDKRVAKDLFSKEVLDYFDEQFPSYRNSNLKRLLFTS